MSLGDSSSSRTARVCRVDRRRNYKAPVARIRQIRKCRIKLSYIDTICMALTDRTLAICVTSH